MSNLYRQLPKVDRVLAQPSVAALPPAVARTVVRQVLDELRTAIGAGTLDSVPDVAVLAVERAQVLLHGRLRPVLNATGVVVHTNLGRAPWSDRAIEAAVDAARACNLEMELHSGVRGGRLDGIRALLGHLVGAESAAVVNNCAAAVLLALTAYARGSEVIISRGELVEIGGSFRVPEVISAGGAHMVEVGTTNRTRIGDYEAAIGPETRVLLRVHRSNFRLVGFAESPERSEMVQLAAEQELVVVEDLGSGSIEGLHDEPSVRDAVEAGVDLVLFSGDKLLGGPQAGIIVGKAEAVARLRSHPLYRALRVDKVTLAALEATLAEIAAGGHPPVQAMLSTPMDTLHRRAEHLAELLQGHGVSCEVRRTEGFVGGGSLPGIPLPSAAAVVPCEGVASVARSLRLGEPSVVARVAESALWLDARTLREQDLAPISERVAAVLGA